MAKKAALTIDQLSANPRDLLNPDSRAAKTLDAALKEHDITEREVNTIGRGLFALSSIFGEIDAEDEE